MQKEALVTSGSGGTTWRVSSDEGPYLMGDDVAPCPLAHMTTGMVACFMEAFLKLADERGIRPGHARLTQDNYYTMKGSALRGTMTGGALPVELTLETDSEEKPDDLSQLIADAASHAPVNGLIDQVLNSRFTLTHNGVAIPLGRVASIDTPAAVFPEGMFDRIQPADGDWSDLVSRNGMSPETNEITSSAGSSYAEEQSRRLHVRGICTVRPDGIKTIEQQLLNPHGSIFHFLSEEGTAAGGQGRAPDALSFVSAGIAFCFMTQIGRYAKIVRKELNEYSIIQDTHFSDLGNGKQCTSDPVETHVQLLTSEDDEFARAALDMSEQTCFLHALCRSEVSVKVKSVRSEARAG